MEAAKPWNRSTSTGAARPFIAVDDYLAALETQSKLLDPALSEIVACSRTILIGSLEPGLERETDPFMDALSRSLPLLKEAGLNYVGVWANAALQGAVDEMVAEELEFAAARDPLAAVRDRLECSASTEIIIRTAKQAGLEVLLLKPSGLEISEFDPEEFRKRVAFMAEKIAARTHQKGLIFTFSADLCGTEYELPGGGKLAPLASVLGKSGGLATLRLVYSDDRSDELARRCAPYLGARLPEGIYCAQNEYPLSASGGMRPEKYQAGYVAFVVDVEG